MKVFLILLYLGISSAIYSKSALATTLVKLEINETSSELEQQTTLPYPKINVNQVFEIFLRAVDLGQMRLFDQTLNREMLQPLQVEYIYTLEDPYPLIKVFSILEEPMPLPNMPDVYVKGVSGVMDINGDIIESIAHCDVGE